MDDEPRTHTKSSQDLVGIPVSIRTDVSSEATLTATANMVVDEWGLIHGGFTFGLADFAAMIAVNEPNVVLTSANVEFLAPVKSGDRVVARATVVAKEAHKRIVGVECFVGDRKVLKGQFMCAVTRRHVLEQSHP